GGGAAPGRPGGFLPAGGGGRPGGQDGAGGQALRGPPNPPGRGRGRQQPSAPVLGGSRRRTGGRSCGAAPGTVHRQRRYDRRRRPLCHGTGPGGRFAAGSRRPPAPAGDRKSTRLNSSHVKTSYAVFCLKKQKRSV